MKKFAALVFFSAGIMAWFLESWHWFLPPAPAIVSAAGRLLIGAVFMLGALLVWFSGE